MARNAEKAMTTLARWRAAQVAENNTEKERRPYIASECESLPACEKWRLQIIREISRKVSQIQNAGLGEFRIRDLNDEINKLIREKRHWENQIRELGGPDYQRTGPRMLDREGKEVPGNRGYKYFGAARDLPGVRELFEHEPAQAPRKSRAELMKDIDADYYGYRDDDDGILEPLELEEEQIAIKKYLENLNNKDENTETVKEDNVDLLNSNKEESDNEENVKLGDAISDNEDDYPEDQNTLVPHVDIPSQKEIAVALLNRKKQILLEKYGDLNNPDTNNDTNVTE